MASPGADTEFIGTPSQTH
uniref:Uncharacterized protein n=1 Tax=Anguilla anguilla TaxID=7936 RepID=A0A0E9TN49_ANGAN